MAPDHLHQKMSTETDIKNTIFSAIKKLLEKDKDLCNYSRYIDYGTFKENVWSTKPCVLNDNNITNQTQLIRFVDDLNSKFIKLLTDHINNMLYYHTKESDTALDSLFVRFYNRCYGIKRSYKKSVLDNDIQSIMVNLDCNYKITGSSLTALDFLDKNPRMTDNERHLYKSLCVDLCRLIFVGDKCYLLAMIDRSHNIYISTKQLINIYKKDKSENKETFYLIVLKLFKLIERCCIYFLKCGMAQYYKGLIVSNVINQIPPNKLTTDEKISLHTLDDLNFSDDKEKDQEIKKNIDKNLDSVLLKIINSSCYISNINIGQIITSIKENMTLANKHLVEKAYKNGLTMHNIFTSMGWSYVDPSVRRSYKYNYVNIRENHIYISKDVNIVPKIAYITIGGVGRYRILKNFVLNDNKYYSECNKLHGGPSDPWHYPYKIHTLYLDVTEGILYCDGNHPNVSNGSVCMGDLRGKVTFSNCNEEEIGKLLQDCEDLLKCINYTSAYNSSYDFLFKLSANSKNYMGAEVDESEEEEQSEYKTKELDFVSNNMDVEEISESENETTENNSSRTVHTIQVPSINIVDVNNADEFEFEDNEVQSGAATSGE